MLHHLYGILERPSIASRIPETGVDDRPVLVRRIGGFAVLSTLLDATPEMLSWLTIDCDNCTGGP